MKKKRNWILIAILTTICLIIVLGLFLFLKTDFFRTKRSAFLRYFDDIPEALSLLQENIYADYMTKKKTTAFIRTSNMSIQSSSNIADSKILDKIKLTIYEKNDALNEKMSADITISNVQDTLEKISLIRNKNRIGFSCDDITQGYIALENTDLKRIAKNFGIKDITLIPNQIKSFNIDKIFETTKVEKSKIQDCLNIMKNDVPTTAYKKEGRKKVKINEETYSTNAYSLTLDTSRSANLQISLLTKISQDSILMDYITSKCVLLNLNEEYTNINSLNELMKNKIEELKKDSSKAKPINMVVYEYKQKNIRNEITYGETKIIINHLKNENVEMSSIKINDKTIKITRNNAGYILQYKDDENSGFSLNIDYSQSGTIEDNNIKNKMTITQNSGIKNIVYVYEDQINFTNEIGKIEDFDGKNVGFINETSDDEMKQFFTDLKALINRIYVNKGASLGINLDPIFNM